MCVLARRVISAGFVAFVSLFTVTAAAQVKVAIVDVQRAVALTEEGLRAAATLRKEFGPRQQELNFRQGELQKQKGEIDKQAHDIAPQALQKKLEDWQRNMADLQQKYVDAQKDLEKQQKALTDPIVEKVMTAIKRIAGTDGLDLIVDRSAVDYSRGDLNLINSVIQMANGSPGGPAGPPSSPPAPVAAPANNAGPAKGPAPSSPAKRP